MAIRGNPAVPPVLVLSLQGCMAVGKTTAARWLARNAPELTVFLEDSAAPIAEVRRRGLDKTWFEDYLAIQRIWIAHEIARWQAVQRQARGCAVLDYGAEEIEFYTLFYPRSIGADWPVERALAPELAALRRCMPARTLFLRASPGTLRRRAAADASRSRAFFEHTLTALLPAKQAWFAGRPGTDFLDTDPLTPEQVGRRVRAWAADAAASSGPAASV